MNSIDKINKVFVIGTGISGINAANFLLKHGKEVIIYNSDPDTKTEPVREKLIKDAVIITGDLSDEIIDSVDLMVPSPGVFPESEVFQRFVQKNVPIWGEIELAYRFENGTVVAITGTNGKTTTTTLVGKIVKAWNDNTFVVGNIGIPYTGEVDKSSKESYSVAEISSYQLETCISFHAKVAAILNITPDHLDRHHTMDAYAAVKETVTMNQTNEDFCILNFDDERLRDFGNNRCVSEVIWFGVNNRPENGFYYKDRCIYKVCGESEELLLNVDEVKLLGQHNYENIMAALGIASALGIPEEITLKVIREFTAVEHRIEFVEEVCGVRYYNDSKGTNPDASIKAIEAMERPIILIGGGYDKGGEFDEYIKAFNGKVKELVVFGQTADKIIETAKKYGFDKVKRAQTFEQVVNICRDDADEGDCVLLSPACASWDMFKSFEERGRIFKEYVRNFKYN